MVVYLRECLAGMLLSTLKKQPIPSSGTDSWYLYGVAGVCAEAERYVQHCLDEARSAEEQPSTELHDYIVFVKHIGGKHTFVYTIREKSENEAKGLVRLAFDNEHSVDEWDDWLVTAIEVSLALKVQSIGRLEGRI